MKIAIIGDIHGSWDVLDTSFFNGSDLDAILFTGDLPRITGKETLSIARCIARLEIPFALIAGNHDCATLASLIGEIGKFNIPSQLAARKIERRYRRMQEILGPGLIGYSSIRLGGVSVVGARPFAMDGTRLSFAAAIERLFGVRSLAESEAKISTLLHAAEVPVVVLAHNGPHGLGAGRDDMYGIDFRSAAGDNGDSDLAGAIAGSGNIIRMVVAGHMHHAVRGMPGTRRQFYLRRNGILYVNGARVPRYSKGKAFYLQAELGANSISLTEISYDRRTCVISSQNRLLE